MKDINYFAITFLGIPFSLTESNLKSYLYFGLREGYTKEELLTFAGVV